MTLNVGTTDRWVRIVLGLVVIVLGFYFQSWWGALGLIFLATGLIRWCPLYVPFKFNTIKKA
jgi:type IV secretory pathway TrbD component